MYVIVAVILIAMTKISLHAVIDNFTVLEHHGCDSCERVYVPVCGTDDKTYVNACKLNCANSVRKKHEWAFIKRYGPCINIDMTF